MIRRGRVTEACGQGRSRHTAIRVFAMGLAGVAASCSSATGIQGKPCRPGCVDDKTRLECNADGSPREVPCKQPAEACAESVCRAGACEVQTATGAPCGKDGSATCNAAGACLGPALTLTAIRQHTCAVTDDGKVWCWGKGPRGELGDGTMEDRGVPVPVRGLPGPALMATAGYAHTCALLGEGQVYCWGDNTGGQTAPDSTDNPVTEPRLLVSPVAFTNVFAGQGHTCGLTADATVYCWGNTAAGQCGVDPSDAFQVGPTQIPGLDHVSTVVTVKNHLCAVRTEDPTLVCWGSNQYLEGTDDGTIPAGKIIGKLGPGAVAMKFSTAPVAVDLGKKVVAAGMSYESTYAVTEDGMVYAWGYNGAAQHQLGSGLSDLDVSTPTPVLVDAGTPLANAVELARSDGSDLCAKVRDTADSSHYVCWGENDFGELALGIPGYKIVPFAMTTVLPEATSNLVRGEDHGCATVSQDGTVDVWCWGRMTYVANGSPDPNAGQPDPAPVSWDPSVFSSMLESP